MKLSAWAKQQGVSYKTAWRWWKAGQLPVPTEQMPTGTVIVDPQPTADFNLSLLPDDVAIAGQRAVLRNLGSDASPTSLPYGISHV